MRRLSALIALLGATALPQAPARAAPFDGIWSVTQECEPAPGGARGFKWLYDATVKDGRLLGQYGSKDKPSSLTLAGRVQADGTAALMPRGLMASQRTRWASVNRAKSSAIPSRPASRRRAARASGPRAGRAGFPS